jgi:hypothetical protein
VNRLHHLVALVLLALWVPATNHCGLEAAGLTGSFACEHEARDDSCKHDCMADMCETVEKTSFAKNGDSLRALPAPAALSELSRLLSPPPPKETGIEPPRTDPPDLRALQRTWSFARRAALPARAPTFAA